MKFWQKLLAAALGIIIISLAQFIYKQVSTPSHFVITPDTKIDPNSELAKYVTQEEVDELSFKHWDIYDEQKIRYQEPNATLKILRDHLEAKDTNGVLKFLKDNNLSADVKLWANTTPLMYASFHNDEVTAKELIKLGANPHQTDKYKLSPLAYAIENNSTKTAKLLLDSGVKFKELGKVQIYRSTPLYSDIEKLIVDDDNITIIYSFSGAKKFYYGYTDEKTGKTSRYTYMYDELPFRYIVENNFTEITRLVLESGYRPDCTDRNREDDEACYRMVDNVPNYEPMLDLLLKYDLPGQPSEEELKKAYDECYYQYILGIVNSHGIDDNGTYFIKYTSFTDNEDQKHCSDKNSTFKDTKEFISWVNERNKTKKLDSLLYSYKACNDRNSKEYRRDNYCIGYEQKVFFKGNQTKLNIKPYRKLSSDEIKNIVLSLITKN